MNCIYLFFVELRFNSFAATIWYESWVKSYGLTKVAILGAILHFSFVIITVVGLFVPGSMYMFYLDVSSAEQCPQQVHFFKLK